LIDVLVFHFLQLSSGGAYDTRSKDDILVWTRCQ